MNKPPIIDPNKLLAACDQLTDDEVWEKWCLAGERMSRESADAFMHLHSHVVLLALSVGVEPTRVREQPATPDTWASLGSLIMHTGTVARRDLAIIAANADLMPSDQMSEPLDLEIATESAPLRFAHVEHAEHCRVGGCAHPPRFSARARYWCSRCRAVADRGFAAS